MINGQPAYIDLGFVLGENGAHINISGQSGVAAKTSYATFLMAAMLQRGQGEDRYASALREGRYIVFNMKGESLFFLDCDSEDWLKADEADRQMWSSMYSAMGLDPEWKFLWITSITVESLKALAPGYSKNQTLSPEVTLEKIYAFTVGFHRCYSIPPFRTGAGPGRNVHESKHAASTFQCAGENGGTFGTSCL